LCGPCKNLRVERVQRPARLVPGALIGLILGVVSAPVLFCTTSTPLGLDASSGARAFWFLVGMLLPGASLVVSLLALREIENRPGRGGRALALTGAVCGLTGLLWSLSLAILMISRVGED